MKFCEKSIQLGESMVKYTKKVDEKISSLKEAVFHKIKLLKSLKMNKWPFGDWKFGEKFWFGGHHMM